MEWSVIISWGLYIVLGLNLLFALAVIFAERRDVGATWAWLLVLFFLPIIGFIIYLFLGRQLKKDNFFNLSVEERSFHALQVESQIEQIRRKETALAQPVFEKYEQLLEMNLRSSKSLISVHNKSAIMHDGEQKFKALMDDIRSAETEINIQYYIIQRDALGKALIHELIERAKAGVKVRLLYDAVGSRSLRDSDFKELIAHDGEVRVFFPPTLGLINFKLNNRNHRKVVIIDGKIGYVGGFNVGTEYLGLVEKFGYWRDTHLRVEGDVVYHLQHRFILDWNYSGSKHHDPENSFCFARHDIKDKSPMQIVTSGPNSDTEHLKNMMIKMIMSAKHRVIIQTPYFIPDTSFMDACKMALLSGVKMDIMIPGKPDHPFVMWASLSFLGELLDYGANVYMYGQGFLHAKTLVVDDEISTVGTTNLDARSFRLNFEVNAVIYDQRVALELASLFESDVAVSRKYTVDDYAARKWTVRMREGVSRLLSPIL
ncbi:cardiolipin synthase [Exiguobacterium sp. s5]|uniref:cardiolipin synthase n=1 Tax=Exiguobacterium sp. s5 TaxID=2751239 RepID=UPI001BE649F7|nr:cardiolipin synthase [Exiguobacterium sp. s5]